MQTTANGYETMRLVGGNQAPGLLLTMSGPGPLFDPDACQKTEKTRLQKNSLALLAPYHNWYVVEA